MPEQAEWVNQHWLVLRRGVYNGTQVEESFLASEQIPAGLLSAGQQGNTCD